MGLTTMAKGRSEGGRVVAHSTKERVSQGQAGKMGPLEAPRQVGVDACPSRWSWQEHQCPHPRRRGGHMEEEQCKANPRQTGRR